MIAVLPLGLAACGLVLAAALGRAPDFAWARRAATAGLVLGGVTSVAGWLVADGGALELAARPGGLRLVLCEGGFAGLAPVMISAIGVVAVALSDPIGHRLATLRRILVLLSLALAFVVVREIVWLALLWLVSPIVAWSELRARFGTRGVARLFALYQGASVALFLAAAGLHGLGPGGLWVWPLVAAIGLREAVIPGHSWFPRFVERAPLGLVVAFVAPQLGVHAHVELLTQGLPPEAARLVAAFGALTAIVAALLGVVQSSARRSLAWLMMSQTGLVSFGLEGVSEVAHAGSLLAWQVLALATSGFAMTLSALEARRGPLGLDAHSGCFSRTPRMAAGFLVMGLASVGFPSTLGFIAEDLLVQGAVERFPVLAFVLISATALNGMTVMRAFFRLFAGRRSHGGERDLTLRETLALSAVLLALLAGGIHPAAITRREFPAEPARSLPSESHGAAAALPESIGKPRMAAAHPARDEKGDPSHVG